MIFVGDDWAEAHHDVFVMDEHGGRLAGRRLPEGLEGISRLHELIADHVEDPAQVVFGIETERGMWVQTLVAAGYQVFAINPLAVSRYRDRHRVSGAKSDAADAKVLADLVRTDRHIHRPVAGDSNEVEAVKIIARSHQSLIWARTRHTNMMRSALREYYPAALDAFDELAGQDALSVLAKAPTPRAGARLSHRQIVTALRAGGRRRNLDRRATDIQTALSAEHLAAPEPVVDAFAATVAAAVKIIGELNRQIASLNDKLAEHFETHPDAAIYLSMPGLGRVLGARVLGEFGDDADRYADAKSRRNYAGTSPLTVASGTKTIVRARFIRNRRLYNAIDQWALCSMNASAGCRAFYDHRRAAGDLHHQALRALGNRLVGLLHGCLRNRNNYDEDIAWAHRQQQDAEDNLAVAS